MKRRARRGAGALLACLVLLCGAAPALAASEAQTADLGARIEAYAAGHAETTAGMAVAVFRSDGTLYEDRFGYADIETGLPVDGETVFEWGSVTKLLVWVSVMQLWRMREPVRTKGERALGVLTCCALAAALVNVAYWNTFMFWAL